MLIALHYRFIRRKIFYITNIIYMDIFFLNLILMRYYFMLSLITYETCINIYFQTINLISQFLLLLKIIKSLLDIINVIIIIPLLHYAILS